MKSCAECGSDLASNSPQCPYCRVAELESELKRLKHALELTDHAHQLTASQLSDAASKALNEAADAWQQGEWANAPRRAERISERIANGQYVADWLRARANQKSTTTGNMQ